MKTFWHKLCSPYFIDIDYRKKDVLGMLLALVTCLLFIISSLNLLFPIMISTFGYHMFVVMWIVAVIFGLPSNIKYWKYGIKK